MKEIATERTQDEERVTMPWTVRRPRTKRTGWYGTLRHCHVLVALLAVLVVPRAHIHVTAECHPHGCSLTALDILYDESTRAALEILRPPEASTDGDDDDDDDYDDDGGGGDDGDSGDGDGLDSDSRGGALSALQGAGDDSKTTLTLRGYKGGRVEDQINQDRAMIVSPFNVLPDSSESSPIVAQLLGVFDGHGEGGEKTSQYAIDRIPSLLASKLASIVVDGYKESEVEEALKQTFLEVDKNDPSVGTAGCTATVVLRLGQKLFIANAGDSVSFVGVYIGGGPSLSNPSDKAVQIVFQSREDKPDLPEEKARILAAGGHVTPDDDEDVARAYTLDENNQPQYGLAMSRSLGDWEFLGVIAEPIVDVLDLNEIVQKALASYTESCSNDVDTTENTNEKDRYCEFKDSSNIHIFAASISDGMMDYLSLEDIGKTLATAFFEKESNLHPHSAAEKLIIEAARGWEKDFRGGYRDDIAIASFVVPHL